jgi:hypothetical protein
MESLTQKLVVKKIGGKGSPNGDTEMMDVDGMSGGEGRGVKKCLGLERGVGGCERYFTILALRRVCHMPSEKCAESGIL